MWLCICPATSWGTSSYICLFHLCLHHSSFNVLSYPFCYCHKQNANMFYTICHSLPSGCFPTIWFFLILFLIRPILPSDIKPVNNYTNSRRSIRNNGSSPRGCWLVSTWNPNTAAGLPPKSKIYPSSYIHNNNIQHHVLEHSQFLIIYMLLTFWITEETMWGFLASLIGSSGRGFSNIMAYFSAYGISTICQSCYCVVTF